MRGSVTRAPASRTVRRAAVLAVAVACGIVLASAAACGTSPVGIDACKKIEHVRCESAQACGISLDHPVHLGSTPEENVAACIRYYDDACLHGLDLTKEPSTQVVDACVSAIISGTCDIVKQPEAHPACAFLNPTTTDAATDADANVPYSDATRDVADVVDAASEQ